MFFKKKKKEDEEPEDIEDEADDNPTVSQNQGTGDISIGRLTADIEKLKAQFKTFYEMQKSSNERFTMINEQVGELRAMILDRDKDSKLVEAKATQAIDLVETVQPDKLMIELRKIDNKIEMMKPPMETNEIIINNTIAELKEIRTRISAFKGIEEAMKLGEEVKKGWIQNKKIDADIAKHASKVETIYSEMWKQFNELQKISGIISDLDKSIKQVSSEVDSIKVKMTSLSNKKEFESLIVKFETFEKHAEGVISALNNKISDFEQDFNKNFNEKTAKTTKLIKGFETLAAKTPDLDKYFNLLEEEAKKIPEKDVNVKKIKTPGEDEKINEEQKQGFFAKIKGKFKKKKGA
ncbi:hypothetical protein COS79_02740 [Candidatus Woesearchaeota archaeon CG06_land_8_20_14_3_00_33_13]|nr:MAG: hypothetical protein COS79_02740 [Candidatus Woesearchaeota archaeon CG06_land_8_20_14_3_00_33_13]